MVKNEFRQYSIIMLNGSQEQKGRLGSHLWPEAFRSPIAAITYCIEGKMYLN